MAPLGPSHENLLMPTQWELETAERLSGMETTLRQIHDGLTPIVSDHTTRIGSLERWRARSYGIIAGGAAVLTVLGWMISTLLGARTH